MNHLLLVFSLILPIVFTASTSPINILLRDHSTKDTVPEINLISNGDFEKGNEGFNSEYNYITDTIYHGHYTITSNIHELNYKLTSPESGDHTSSKGNYLVIDSKIFRTGHRSKCWISSTVTIKPTTTYVFSAWAYHVGGKGSSSPEVEVTIRNKPIGKSFIIHDTIQKWQHIYYEWNSGTTKGHATVDIENIYRYQYVEDFAIDDIYFGVK
jgi:hypothetical protein